MFTKKYLTKVPKAQGKTAHGVSEVAGVKQAFTIDFQ